MSKRKQQIENILRKKKIRMFGLELNLTAEQVEEIEKLNKPKYQNPYERVEKGEYYYFIITNNFGEFEVWTSYDARYIVDNSRFENGNHYNDKEFAEQVAMGMNLEQRLRKFTYENGWSEELWDDEFINKWYIAYDYHDCEFGVKSSRLFKQQGTIYFVSEEVAQRAIDEVIKPFMAENPTFVW